MEEKKDLNEKLAGHAKALQVVQTLEKKKDKVRLYNIISNTLVATTVVILIDILCI